MDIRETAEQARKAGDDVGQMLHEAAEREYAQQLGGNLTLEQLREWLDDWRAKKASEQLESENPFTRMALGQDQWILQRIIHVIDAGELPS